MKKPIPFMIIFMAPFLGFILLVFGCKKDQMAGPGFGYCAFQQDVSSPDSRLLFSYTRDTCLTDKALNGLYVVKDNICKRIRNDYGAYDYPANPRWSPDGSKIAYNPGIRSDGRTYGDSILIIHADGSLHSKPVSGCGRNGCILPVWSPDGNRLAYCRCQTKTFSIRIIDLEKASEKVVATIPGTPRGLDWSLNGDGFICVSSHGIFHLKTDGSDLMHCKCLEDFAGTIGSPRWDPSGSKLVFTRKHWSSIPPIFTVLMDGSELREIAYGMDADWTADGSHIVYYSDCFYVIRSDGTGEPSGLFTGDCYPFPYDPSFFDWL